MCGIVGMVGDIMMTTSTAQDRKWFNAALLADTVRGIHSTGCFFASRSMEDGKELDEVSIRWLKDTVTGGEYAYGGWLSELLKPLSREHKKRTMASPSVMVGHNRAATVGSVKLENAHPFKVGNTILVHNGTLGKNSGLKDDTKDIHEVDSARLCHNIDKYGIIDTLERVKGAFTVVVVNYEEGKLYLARNSQRPLIVFEHSGVMFFASTRLIAEFACHVANINPDKVDMKSMPSGELWEFDLTKSKYQVLGSKKVTKLSLQTAPVYGGYGGYTYNNGNTGRPAAGTARPSSSSNFGQCNYKRGADKAEKDALLKLLEKHDKAIEITKGEWWINDTEQTHANTQLAYSSDPADVRRVFAEGLIKVQGLGNTKEFNQGIRQDKFVDVVRVVVHGAPVSPKALTNIVNKINGLQGRISGVTVEDVEYVRKGTVKHKSRFVVRIDANEAMFTDYNEDFLGISYTTDELRAMGETSAKKSNSNVVALPDKLSKPEKKSSQKPSSSSSQDNTGQLWKFTCSKQSIMLRAPKNAEWVTQEPDGTLSFWRGKKPTAQTVAGGFWSANTPHDFLGVARKDQHGNSILENPNWEEAVLRIAQQEETADDTDPELEREIRKLKAEGLNHDEIEEQVADWIQDREDDERLEYVGPGGTLVCRSTWLELTQDGCCNCKQPIRSDEQELIEWVGGQPVCHHCIDVVGDLDGATIH